MNNLNQLEGRIGVSFKKKELLEQALVHRSYLNENPGYRLDQNERLEFLGDAVLELVTTEHLYERFPEKPEGELTNLRAALVNAEMLGEVAIELGLNDYLLLSRGEAKDTGRGRQYILANAFEAVIGAIYLDQGYAASREFVTRELLEKKLDQVLATKAYRDPKSHFQEEAQERAGITPTYEVLQEWGPDHAKNFRVGVFLGAEKVAEGVGPSKQEAQEVAAREALKEKGWS
ncbi:ribonuclease III [Candidatus Azambacteria bacterium]|nr:ribonuclease III [Candidatus Azambacteria bacterium]MBI2587789.1 ribonuclease III [Candidatus Azambacteria bacterium]